MAPRRWVVNASPLILLGKTNHLGLLGALADQVVVPEVVVDEIDAKPDGKPLLRVIAEDVAYTLVDNEVATTEILSWDLGSGETQVIANAQRGVDHKSDHGPGSGALAPTLQRGSWGGRSASRRAGYVVVGLMIKAHRGMAPIVSSSMIWRPGAVPRSWA